MNNLHLAYENCGDHIVITGTLVDDAVVCIPTTINNKPVTAIKDYAFYGNSELTSIVIPNTVTSIGSKVFKKCTKLSSITIPNSVTKIGSNTFDYINDLTTVTLPEKFITSEELVRIGIMPNDAYAEAAIAKFSMTKNNHESTKISNKAFHLYLFNCTLCINGYNETEKAIENGEDYIATTQLLSCTTKLFTLGYKIFIHPTIDTIYEIKLGKNENTRREIRMGHRLYALIAAGEFDSVK